MLAPKPKQLDFFAMNSHWDSNSSIYSNMTLDELLKHTNHFTQSRHRSQHRSKPGYLKGENHES